MKLMTCLIAAVFMSHDDAPPNIVVEIQVDRTTIAAYDPLFLRVAVRAATDESVIIPALPSGFTRTLSFYRKTPTGEWERLMPADVSQAHYWHLAFELKPGESITTNELLFFNGNYRRKGDMNWSMFPKPGTVELRAAYQFGSRVPPVFSEPIKITVTPSPPEQIQAIFDNRQLLWNMFSPDELTDIRPHNWQMVVEGLEKCRDQFDSQPLNKALGLKMRTIEACFSDRFSDQDWENLLNDMKDVNDIVAENLLQNAATRLLGYKHFERSIQAASLIPQTNRSGRDLIRVAQAHWDSHRRNQSSRSVKPTETAPDP